MPGNWKFSSAWLTKRDPVCEIVRRLIAENKVKARLVICHDLVGANAKVAKLAQLERLAAHDFILISDADVRCRRIFYRISWRRFTSLGGLVDWPAGSLPNIGLVNCFYRLANPMTAAMHWEAVAINADFWSQVLQSQTLEAPRFCAGRGDSHPATARGEHRRIRRACRLPRRRLPAWASHSQSGHRIALCPVVVECWDIPQGWARVWKHQLRWARTIRVCQPAPYFFSILSNVTFWAVLWFISDLPRLSATVQRQGDVHNGRFSFILPWAAIVAPALILFRIFQACNLQRRFTPDRNECGRDAGRGNV